MKKCILFSRVSTQQQTLEQQTNELLRFAKNRGYIDSCIIVIEDKESAIKLDEEHRKGLIKMKEYIAGDKDINSVICYEISRISRQQKVLFSIRDYLKERKIQLIILKPYMELLDDKGEITPTANIVFSLFSTLSENEMMLKTERLQRGRKQKKSEGKYGGGKILFGYKIGENNMIEIDEKDSATVKKVFNLYENGMSGGSIAKEMMERGWIRSKNISSAITLINRMLNNKRYIGINDGFDTQYPAILTAEQFYKCREMTDQYIKRGYTNISFIYYSQGLIKSKENGRVLSPCKTTCVYGMYDPNTQKHMTISLNVADSLVWQAVKQHKLENANIDVKTLRGEMTHRLRIYRQKIRTEETEMQNLSKQIERIEKRIIEGKMDEFKGDKMISDIQNEIIRLSNFIDKWKYETESLKEELKNATESKLKRDYSKIKDDTEIANIIHNDVDIIWMSRTDEHAKYRLEFHFKNGQIRTYIVKNNGRARKLWDEQGNELKFDFKERIKRKHY